MDEIQRADPMVRRTALTVVACAAVIGLILAAVADRYRPQVASWVGQTARPRLLLVIAGAAVMTCGPVIAFAWYLDRLGRRVVRAARFPPPDMRLVRHVRIAQGSAAIRRGRLFRVLAVVLGAAGLILAVFFWRLVSLLGPAGT